MLDRFSDGQENGYRDNDGNLVLSGTTPPFSDGDEGNAVASNVDADNWNNAGTRFVGGTLKGLESKIGYLQRLGVTICRHGKIALQPYLIDFATKPTSVTEKIHCVSTTDKFSVRNCVAIR